MNSFDDLNFCLRHYVAYVQRTRRVPNIFCPYNDDEVSSGIAKTITTTCGGLTGSASHLLVVDYDGRLIESPIDLDYLHKHSG